MSTRQSSLRLDCLLKSPKAGLGGADHEMMLIGISGQVETRFAGSFSKRCKIDVRSNVYLSRSFERIVGPPMPRIARQSAFDSFGL